MHRKVKKLIERIRPVLNSDGGDIMFLGIEKGEVVICMTGKVCRLKDVEKYLVKNVAGISSIRNIAVQPEEELNEKTV